MFSREVSMLDKFLEKSQTIPIIVCMYNVMNNVSVKTMQIFSGNAPYAQHSTKGK